jgi:RHS repeat-associated protein
LRWFLVGSPFTFTGELLDANALLYLRARYYSPTLGVFPSLDPLENLNRYQYVGANPVNDAIGELMAMNRYAYANDNPVNFTDPSGLQVPGDRGSCWDRCRLDPCEFSRYHGIDCTPCSGGYLCEQHFKCVEDCENHFHEESDGSVTDDPILGMFATIAMGAIRRRGTQAAATAVGDWVLPVGDIIGVGLICLGAIETVEALRRQSRTPTYEYRLPGFDKKLGTLAEHLAKLLERDVAGYPPPTRSNPYGDPNAGWCNTIRRVIEGIDDAKITPKQLNRDLQDAGYAGDKWAEIIAAVKDVVEWGLCDDHWGGDFRGGSLAAS